MLWDTLVPITVTYVTVAVNSYSLTSLVFFFIIYPEISEKKIGNCHATKALNKLQWGKLYWLLQSADTFQITPLFKIIISLRLYTVMYAVSVCEWVTMNPSCYYRKWFNTFWTIMFKKSTAHFSVRRHIYCALPIFLLLCTQIVSLILHQSSFNTLFELSNHQNGRQNSITGKRRQEVNKGKLEKKILEHGVCARLGLFALIYSGSWVCIKANRATLMKSSSAVEILSRLLIYTQSTQLKDPWLRFIKHARVLEVV